MSLAMFIQSNFGETQMEFQENPMGIDIRSETGFFLTYDSFLQLIKPAHIWAIKVHATQLFLRRLAVVYSSLGESVMLDDEIKSALSQILIASDPNDMVNALTDSMKSGEKWIFNYNDNNSQAFRLIQCVSRVIFPIEPTRIIYSILFDEKDLHDNFLQVPSLFFPSLPCFEVIMSPTGRSVARTLGKSKIEISAKERSDTE